MTVTNSKIRTNNGHIFTARGDAPEFTGSLIIDNCDLVFDWHDRTGTPEASIYNMNMPSTIWDAGRDVFLTEKVAVTNCHVKVHGTGHTGLIELFRVFDEGDTSDNVIVDSKIDFRGNSYSFDNGAQVINAVARKQTYLIGSELNININDDVDVNQVVFNNVVNITAAPFVNFKADNAEITTIKSDYGSGLKSSSAKMRLIPMPQVYQFMTLLQNGFLLMIMALNIYFSVSLMMTC